VGLGLQVGAVLQRPLGAQVDTTRARRDTSRAARDTVRRDTVVRVPARPTADSLLRDSLAKRDSARREAIRRDTLKAPFARAPMPVPIEIGQVLVFDRQALFASSALTIQDLLDRVPGITGLRAGWIAAPMASAYLGDVRRVRFFYDGLEIDELDPKTGGVLDLSQVQIWTLEELRIEPGATEVRIYMRSWRVDRTTPYSRTDVATGDQGTNVYRGFFGRRYRPGQGIQLAAQQYGTTPPARSSPSSDLLSVLARVGWARGAWSVDAFALRNSRNRGLIRPQILRNVVSPSFDSIPALKSIRLDAYVRGAYGDPERGPWLQAIAGAANYHIERENTTAGSTEQLAKDSARFRAQYVLAGGLTRWGLRLEAAERLRVGDGQRLATPSGRAEFVTGPLALNAFAEGRGPDSIARFEAVGRLTPLPFISLLAAAGRSSERVFGDSSVTTTFLRGEAGLRIAGLWLIGGVLRRDDAVLAPPLVFSDSLVPVASSEAIGAVAAVRGRIYRALRANAFAIRWNDSSGFYRPRYQTHSELFISTNWLSRFPSGNFGLLVGGTHEYRSTTRYPVMIDNQPVIASVPDSRTYNFQLEVRIVSAVLSYQFRNIRGDLYQLVPGYTMPRQTQFYGVRWEFWN
jgi:hypothetical protein